MMTFQCLQPIIGSDGFFKFSFLQSLDEYIPPKHCNELAYYYREHFDGQKFELAELLFKIFNMKVFSNYLVAKITWSKLLRITAGRCKIERPETSGSNVNRTSIIELSLKVVTNAARLRCTLIHEMCHAAAWTLNRDLGGHGVVWKYWADRASAVFPELPPIKRCHNFNIEFKYTYKCMNCNKASHSHSRYRKVETLCCSQCKGPVTMLLNKKNKVGDRVSTPVREPKAFAKFIKENFNKFKTGKMPLAQVIPLLSVEYARLKAEMAQMAENQAQNDSSIDQMDHSELDHE